MKEYLSDIAPNVRKSITDFEVSPEFDGYSKVIINVSEDEEGNIISCEAGNDSGRTLEFTCPWGT